ncbi:MAG: PQQ-binding-like beta-propeller repeat protein [Armatimonadota bacterium]
MSRTRHLAACFILTLIVSAAVAAPVGWRTDGTGKYPSATPPTEWAADKNIVWSTPMPSWSNATPVPVGDKLFLCSEPDTLLCVSATDGKILWQRTNGYKDVATPEDAAVLDAANAQAAELRKQYNQAAGEFYRTRTALQDKPDDAELKAKLEEAKQKMADLQAQLKPLDANWYVFPKTYAINGFSTPTPVCDGQRVYALFNHGVVAAYDLDGNLLWRRFTEKSNSEWGHSTSPVIADGKLIIHILNLTALDLATGKEIWKVRLPEDWGTPQVGKIGDTAIIVTANGDLVRASDGKVLASKLCRLEYGDPILAGDRLYFIHNDGGTAPRAFKLPASIDEANFKPELLWTAEIRKDRYYAASVLDNGIIYAVTQTGILNAIDTETGKVIYEQALGAKPTYYPAIAMAGNFLFVSNDQGTTFVIKPGRTFELVGQNNLEPFRSCPVFIGNKLYLRGLKNLYCIGTN